MITQRVNLLSTNFKPKNEYIIVKPAASITESMTDTGIFIALRPQTSVDRPTMGVVLAVGEDITDIKENDVVLWPNTDGLDIEFTDGIFILLRYKSIIGSSK